MLLFPFWPALFPTLILEFSRWKFCVWKIFVVCLQTFYNHWDWTSVMTMWWQHVYRVSERSHLVVANIPVLHFWYSMFLDLFLFLLVTRWVCDTLCSEGLENLFRLPTQHALCGGLGCFYASACNLQWASMISSVDGSFWMATIYIGCTNVQLWMFSSVCRWWLRQDAWELPPSWQKLRVIFPTVQPTCQFSDVSSLWCCSCQWCSTDMWFQLSDVVSTYSFGLLFLFWSCVTATRPNAPPLYITQSIA